MTTQEDLRVVAESICKYQDYTYVSEIGAGVFKTTFHVKTADGMDKALKVYKGNTIDARVEREIRALTKCNHANIVRFEFIDKIEVKGVRHLFSVEEFLSATSLERRLERAALSVDECWILGESLVRTIGYIASLDLVHRDLKPANIMMRGDEIDPVVVDFGLVRDLTASSLTGTWEPRGPGTPLYSAPEQLNNDKDLIEWRTDQFSLGVLLAMAVSGNHPYQQPGMSAAQAVEQIAKRSQLPETFTDWAKNNSLSQIIKMVKPWPVQRFRTPEELVKAWER